MSRVVPLLVLALALAHVSAASAVRPGPSGAAFYNPPKRLVRGHAGTPIWVRAAGPLVALPEASRTVVLAYRSTSARGKRVAMSGSLALPKGSAPPGGWPTVVWNHVTTGSADSCAPSLTTAKSPERERMTRADPTVRKLLAAGIAVVRPDYEGIGTPGPHPYLIGRSLARSSADAVRAARRVERLSPHWAVAGHSEGGVAALFTAALARKMAPGLDLRAADAMAPPTHMHDLFEYGGHVPVTSGVTADLSSLAGLVLDGAAVAKPSLWRLYRDGGLSQKALALMPDVRDRCLLALDKPDSWGGIAPSDIPGPNADAAKPALYKVLDENDPRTLRISGLPVRIDQGAMDPVVPIPFTEELVQDLESNGTDVTYERYPTGTHQNITSDGQAAGPAAAWLREQLR